MGTATGNDIARRASVLLNDLAESYWRAGEKLDFINRIEREIVRLKPTANVVNQSVRLAAGQWRQPLPDAIWHLVSVDQNLGSDGQSRGEAIRLVDVERVNSLDAGWQERPNNNPIRGYAFDLRRPREFVVYPRAPDGPWFVEVSASVAPNPLETLTDPISLHDSYQDLILDGVMWLAWSKDIETAASAAKAQSYEQRFLQGVGGYMTTQQAVDPNTWGRETPANLPGYSKSQRAG